jgi:hypothetical protein
MKLIRYVDASAANRKPFAVTWPAVASYRKLRETIPEFQ